MKARVAALAVLMLVLLNGYVCAAQGGIMRVAGDVVVEEQQVIVGDVIVLRGNVEIHGEITGDVVALTGQITVASGGVVRGDAVSLVGGIDVLPGGQIFGDQVAIVVGGEELWDHMPRIVLFQFNLGRSIFRVVVRVVLAVLVAALFPGMLLKVRQEIAARPAAAAAFGLLAWGVALPATAILLLTIIGGLLAMVLLWGAVQLGLAALAALVGDRLLHKCDDVILATALGALLLAVPAQVPLLGLVYNLGLWLVTLGGVCLVQLGANRRQAT